MLKALEQAGKLGQVKVVGFDNHPETLAGIEDGHVAATIVQDQFGCGFHTVRILAEAARGDRSGLPMFQRRTLPVEIITKDEPPGRVHAAHPDHEAGGAGAVNGHGQRDCAA